MEVVQNGRVIIVERQDLQEQYKDLPLEDIKLKHLYVTDKIDTKVGVIEGGLEFADIIIFNDALSKSSILKNMYGGTGIAKLPPSKRNITITFQAVDNSPNEDFDILDEIGKILGDYLEEIQDRINNTYDIDFYNTVIDDGTEKVYLDDEEQDRLEEDYYIDIKKRCPILTIEEDLPF